MFLTKIRNIFCVSDTKICVRNKCYAHGQTGKHLCPQQCIRNVVSSFATTFSNVQEGEDGISISGVETESFDFQGYLNEVKHFQPWTKTLSQVWTALIKKILDAPVLRSIE